MRQGVLTHINGAGAANGPAGDQTFEPSQGSFPNGLDSVMNIRSLRHGTPISIRWFKDIRLADVPLVGGKNASLGELYSNLSDAGVRVPNGFALTAQAYRDALTEAAAWDKLHRLLDTLDKTQAVELVRCAAEARAIVYAATGTDRLRLEIAQAYTQLEAEYGSGVAVAVRSSATAEDLPTASFAGQHESFLNIRGAEDLFEACRRCFASIFTDRAISYRTDQGFDHFKVALSVGVMKWYGPTGPRAASSSRSIPNRASATSFFITGAYGLGENIVQGLVDPDEFYVHKRLSGSDIGLFSAARSGRSNSA